MKKTKTTDKKHYGMIHKRKNGNLVFSVYDGLNGWTNYDFKNNNIDVRVELIDPTVKLIKSKNGKNYLDYAENFKSELKKTNYKGTNDYTDKEWIKLSLNDRNKAMMFDDLMYFRAMPPNWLTKEDSKTKSKVTKSTKRFSDTKPTPLGFLIYLVSLGERLDMKQLALATKISTKRLNNLCEGAKITKKEAEALAKINPIRYKAEEFLNPTIQNGFFSDLFK
ncbi:MAG: hypothetical protein ABL930_13025 [Pseudobdellovibrio sp.]